MSLLESVARVGYWTVPAGVKHLITPVMRQKLARQMLSGEIRELLDRNNALRNRHAGERCFIIATGPSIQTQNLRPLANELCISVSNFFVHPDFVVIKPKYHCVAPYHAPITEEAWQAWLTELFEHTHQTKLFFGSSDRERNESNPHYRKDDAYYLRFIGGFGEILRENIDLTQILPFPGSVTVMALMLALFFGCKEIYLLGCDHDWLAHYKQSRHFYDEQQHVLNRNGYDEWADSEYEAQLRSMVNLWENYTSVRQYASTHSARIYNATNGGVLDVFPRVDYQALFPQSSNAV
ncbi:MAG: hypothetical protein JWQ02_3969 [Capsulimonas sp.]|nr:hypothetical protein [Capsulimonas sp.]